MLSALYRIWYDQTFQLSVALTSWQWWTLTWKCDLNKSFGYSWCVSLCILSQQQKRKLRHLLFIVDIFQVVYFTRAKDLPYLNNFGFSLFYFQKLCCSSFVFSFSCMLYGVEQLLNIWCWLKRHIKAENTKSKLMFIGTHLPWNFFLFVAYHHLLISDLRYLCKLNGYSQICWKIITILKEVNENN